jgi:hypothetical protein
MVLVERDRTASGSGGAHQQLPVRETHRCGGNLTHIVNPIALNTSLTTDLCFISFPLKTEECHTEADLEEGQAMGQGDHE